MKHRDLAIAIVVVLGVIATGVYVSTVSSSASINNYQITSQFTSSYQASTVSSSAQSASSYPDSYYWSMPMMNSYYNKTWMEFPTQTINITQAVLQMRDPPSYVTAIKSNDTLVFHSSNITILAFGMMPSDAANLTGMTPPSYSTDDVFVIYGLINPTMVIPEGANIHMIFVNLDSDMYHNFVFTTISPPYSYMPMQAMMSSGGGMMGNRGSNNNSTNFYYMMPFVLPASYEQGMAHGFSYSFRMSGQSSLWYVCTYPGHAESGMYGKIAVRA